MPSCRLGSRRSRPSSWLGIVLTPAAVAWPRSPASVPIGASMLVMKTPAPEIFRSGRQFAAWMGLTPKDHSTAGKVRLGVITRAGDEGLRSVLVVGATAVLRHLRNGNGESALAPWLAQLLKRKAPKLVAVALANKIARIAWQLMVRGQNFAVRIMRPPPWPTQLRRSARRREHYQPLRAEPLIRTCKVTSRWCDRSIQDARHSERPSGR